MLIRITVFELNCPVAIAGLKRQNCQLLNQMVISGETTIDPESICKYDVDKRPPICPLPVVWEEESI